MIDLFASLGIAFSIGLLGGGHCIGMCGGIAGALGLTSRPPSSVWPLLLAYNLGRIATYCVIAGGLGWLLSLNPHFLHSGHGLSIGRLVAGALLVALGLYLGGFWYGLVWLEKAGAVLWRTVQPWSRHFIPVDKLWQAFGLGLIWGWLPCGLVYSALAYAVAQGDGRASFLTMLAFGLGTLPVMLASGLLAARIKALMQQQRLRRLMGLLVCGFGVWTLLAGLGWVGAGSH